MEKKRRERPITARAGGQQRRSFKRAKVNPDQFVKFAFPFPLGQHDCGLFQRATLEHEAPRTFDNRQNALNMRRARRVNQVKANDNLDVSFGFPFPLGQHDCGMLERVNPHTLEHDQAFNDWQKSEQEKAHAYDNPDQVDNPDQFVKCAFPFPLDLQRVAPSPTLEHKAPRTFDDWQQALRMRALRRAEQEKANLYDESENDYSFQHPDKRRRLANMGDSETRSVTVKSSCESRASTYRRHRESSVSGGSGEISSTVEPTWSDTDGEDDERPSVMSVAQDVISVAQDTESIATVLSQVDSLSLDNPNSMDESWA